MSAATSFSFGDYGPYLPGQWGLVATGSDQGSSLPLVAKFNHFVSVPMGAGCMLPLVSASRTLTITILNRDPISALLVYPAQNSVIEALGPNMPASVPAGMCAEFSVFDSVLAPGRQWYVNLTAGLGSFLPISGGTMSGPLYLAGNATSPLQAVPLQQLNSAIAAAPFLPLVGGTVSGALSVTGPLNVTANGAALARSVQTKFAERIDLLDYILPGDPDATAGFNRAVAAALALNRPVRIQVPSGTYSISTAIAITLASNQGIHLAGDSSATTIIQQTADADAFDVSITGLGGNMLGAGFAFTGLTVRMAAGASTSRIALNFSTTGVTGQTGVPLVIDDVVTTSTNSAAYWRVDISLVNVPNLAYLSRIACNAIVRSGTGIIVSGSSGCYTTGIYLRDVTVTGHAIGIDLQNYLQGIQIFNFNTIGSSTAVNCTPSAGLNLSINLRGCYLHGQTNIQPTAANLLSSVAIADTYFDSIGTVLSAGANHVTFTNVPVVQILGCTFNGPGTATGSTANVTGLTINGATTTYETIIANNVFQAYAFGGTALNIASGRQIQVRGNSFQNNSTDIVDGGTGTCFAETSLSGTFYLFGTPQSTGTAANVNGPINSTASINTTGNVAVGSNTSTSSNVYINGAAGNVRGTYYQTAGVVRWLVYEDNTAEPGGGTNGGSNFIVRAYSDAGAGLFNPISINRATGLVSMAQGLAAGAGATTWTSGTGAPASTQPAGSLWSRTDGATGTRLYVSAGAGTWNAVAGV